MIHDEIVRALPFKMLYIHTRAHAQSQDCLLRSLLCRCRAENESLHACAQAHARTHTHTDSHMHTHTHTDSHMHTYTHTQTHTQTHTCTHTRTHACTHTHIHKCACTCWCAVWGLWATRRAIAAREEEARVQQSTGQPFQAHARHQEDHSAQTRACGELLCCVCVLSMLFVMVSTVLCHGFNLEWWRWHRHVPAVSCLVVCVSFLCYMLWFPLCYAMDSDLNGGGGTDTCLRWVAWFFVSFSCYMIWFPLCYAMDSN